MLGVNRSSTVNFLLASVLFFRNSLAILFNSTAEVALFFSLNECSHWDTAEGDRSKGSLMVVIFDAFGFNMNLALSLVVF